MDKQLKIQEAELRIKIPLIFPFSLLYNKAVSTEDVSCSLMFVKVSQREWKKKKTKLFLVQLCQIETEFLITNTIMQVAPLKEQSHSN